MGHAAANYRGQAQTAHHGGIIMSNIDYSVFEETYRNHPVVGPATGVTTSGYYEVIEPPTIPGVDVSKWQGMMDWAKCKAAGAKWAFMRASVGASYEDPQFNRNYEELDHIELPFGAYHVVVPRYNGKVVTADANMDNFFKVLDGDPLNFPVILDCEVTNGDNPRHITSVIEGCIKILEAEGYEVMIYTGAWWWDGNVMPADKWRNYPLHVANYTSAAQPYMPRDWEQWDVWQWSADGNGKGHEYGADSHDIDLNRMKVEFWNTHIGVIEEPEPVPSPEPSKVITLQQSLRGIHGNDVYTYEGEVVLDLIDE